MPTTKVIKKKKTTRTKVKADLPQVEAKAKVEVETVEKAEKHAPKPKGRYIFAIGRRKTATAKVKVFEGGGSVLINDRPAKDYFTWATWHKAALQPLSVVGVEKNTDVVARVSGGGLHAQADAVAHGIARALVIKDETFKKVLRTNGLLTRDPRMKERKKPGLKKARRAPQWSKR